MIEDTGETRARVGYWCRKLRIVPPTVGEKAERFITEFYGKLSDDRIAKALDMRIDGLLIYYKRLGLAQRRDDDGADAIKEKIKISVRDVLGGYRIAAAH